jgi:hypothetical protein
MLVFSYLFYLSASCFVFFKRGLLILFFLNESVSVVFTERCSPPQVFSGARFPGAVEVF